MASKRKDLATAKANMPTKIKRMYIEQITSYDTMDSHGDVIVRGAFKNTDSRIVQFDHDDRPEWMKKKK